MSKLDGHATMSIPGDNSGAAVTPTRDDAKDIVRAILTMIRIWGRLTGRAPEAEGIAISVLNATEGR